MIHLPSDDSNLSSNLMIGFDPSLTNLGWVVCDMDLSREIDLVVESGRFHTNAKQTEVDRYNQLRAQVSALLLKYPNAVRTATETPYVGDTYSEGLYSLFVQMQQVLKSSRRDVVFFTPPQVHAFGRVLLGRPSWWKWMKSDSVESAKTFTDQSKWSNDEADAYLVAKMGFRFWCVLEGSLRSEDLSEYERRSFLKDPKKASRRKKQQVGMVHKENSRFFRWSQSNVTEENHGENEQ